MSIRDRLASLISLVIERPAAIGAMAAWPSFSITSYRMLDDLRRQGVLPATVIDVGANVGQFACAALRLLRPRKVHVFEPLPGAVDALRRRLGAEAGVEIHPVALGAAPSDLTLHVNAHTHSSSFLALGEGHRVAFPEATYVGEETVSVRTLDAELTGADLPRPMLIKLDVQGYERWVLEGAPRTLAKADWVVLETSFRPLYEGEPTFLEMVSYMNGHGFRLLRPVGWLVVPETGEVLQCDALFGRAPLENA